MTFFAREITAGTPKQKTVTPYSPEGMFRFLALSFHQPHQWKTMGHSHRAREQHLNYVSKIITVHFQDSLWSLRPKLVKVKFIQCLKLGETSKSSIKVNLAYKKNVKLRKIIK